MKYELAAVVLALLGGPFTALVPKALDDGTGCLVAVCWGAAVGLMVVGLVRG